MNRLRQLLRRGLDPKRVRIQTDKFRVPHLAPHFTLQLRVDVAQKNVFRIAVAGGNFRLKLLEDIHLQIMHLAIVGILPIFARPVKCLARGVLDSGDIDAMFAENLFVLFAKVLAHNRNYTNLGKVARRKRKKCR